MRPREGRREEAAPRRGLALTALVCLPALLDPAAAAGEGGARPWAEMDHGPFITATLEAPRPPPVLPGEPRNLTPKAVIISLRQDRSAQVAFDTDLLRLSAAWTGGFVDWRNIAFDGSHGTHLSLSGAQAFGTRNAPGWSDPRGERGFSDPRPIRAGPLPRDWGRYRGLHVHSSEVVLAYQIGDTEVLELFGLEEHEGRSAFSRTLELSAAPRPLRLRLLDEPGARSRLLPLPPAGPGEAPPGLAVLEVEGGGSRAAALRFAPAGARLGLEGPAVVLEVPASAAPASIKVLLGAAGPGKQALPETLLRASPPPRALSLLTRGGPRRFPEEVVRRGILGGGEGPYALDDLAVPLENPWRSWLRPGGFDFFEDGRRAAVASWTGDVWTVEGIDAGLDRLVWRRVATGLFQPLGLEVIGGRIHVLGRDAITVLEDSNGDGEADFYRCLNNDHQVSEHFHEFAMDLQEAPDGALYYLKGACHAQDATLPQQGTLLRVEPGGGRTEIVARGFRAPNGLALGAGGAMLSTDQEGHWMPMNRLNWIEPGGFYGYRLTVWEDTAGSRSGDPLSAVSPGAAPPVPAPPWRAHHPRPLRYDLPLTWIHKTLDRSPAAPVVVESDRFGLPRGSLLLLSYGTGRVWNVLHERVEGLVQGGIARLPVREAPTGIHRGRFHPGDGQLYVCGLHGWSSDRTLPGGLYRVRYTGRPLRLPVELRATRAGILLGFSSPLEPGRAVDPEGFAVSAWNYHWSEAYGSPDYRLSSWTPGRERLEVRSARLSLDRKAVFLEVEDMPLCMQLQVRYRVTAEGGERLRGEVQGTVNVLGEASALAGRFEGGLPAPSSRAAPEPPPFPAARRPRAALLAAGESGRAAGRLAEALREAEERVGIEAVLIPGAGGAASPAGPRAGEADVLVVLSSGLEVPALAGEDLRGLISTKPLVVVWACPQGAGSAAGSGTAGRSPARVPLLEEALGVPWRFVNPPGRATLVTTLPEAAGSPLLAGLPPQVLASSALIHVEPLSATARPLLLGRVLGPREGSAPSPGKESREPRPQASPVAWIDTGRGRRVFSLTLGTAEDLDRPEVRRLLRNALRWALKK